MYKIGDIVRINKRIDDELDYPLNFVSDMAKLHGKFAKIVGIVPFLMGRGYEKRKRFNGDLHIYKLNIDRGEWNWSSSMFTKSISNNFIDLNSII